MSSNDDFRALMTLLTDVRDKVAGIDLRLTAHCAAEEALKAAAPPRAPVTAWIAMGAAVVSTVVSLFVTLAPHVR